MEEEEDKSIIRIKIAHLNITYLLHGPSWAASQEIPRISRNPKVHYRTHKRPPPISILG